MADRIEISEITISNSTRVKPVIQVRVLSAIERLSVRLRVHVEDVAAAPRCRVGPVPVGAHAPLVRLGHRIDGNAPQELQLHTGRVASLGDALDENLEALGVILTAGGNVERRDPARVRGVLELVDRGAHLTQGAAQFNLTLTLHRHPRQRHDCGRQHHQDGADNK
jgi:hypothetical protein